MRLSTLLARPPGAADPEIAGVTADSRAVRPGWLFAALPGVQVDGARFVPQALAAGAAAVIAAEGAQVEARAPTYRFKDVRRAYALAAARLQASQPDVCVAVTGTNGKTSVATFARQLFGALGRSAASMGTLGVETSTGEVLTPPGLTTPDAAEVARLAADLHRRGVTHLALEASSHGLDQRRLDGLRIKAGGFTNLSQDHLDYHADMGAYRAAKLELFERLVPRGGTAVLNADVDEFPVFAGFAVMHGQTVLGVGERGPEKLRAAYGRTPFGQRLLVDAGSGAREVRLPLAGAFQASNVLVAAGLALAVGEDADAVLAACERLEGAPGRLQRVGGVHGAEAYVDYAHTPDGLRTVLEALRPHVRGRLVAVIGAGGDRDRAKRPLMGAEAHRLADAVVVTDDNPRSEDPAAIRAEVLRGAPGAAEVGDRREAIRSAVASLCDGDVLVVAGKGHEQGQTVAGVVHPFDDVHEVRAALEAQGG